MNSRLIRIVSLIVLSLFVMCSMAFAATDSKEWFWLNSDEKYSKYYSPSDVRTMQAFDGIAVKIRAWTKTTYSPGGAQETLENYNITDINPLDLSYSLAEVHINPQNRTLAYVQELFYDADGRVLWQKEYNPLRYKEMTSQEFDEDFYTSIVDSVFGQGEVERQHADDRWLLLWQETADNRSIRGQADTDINPLDLSYSLAEVHINPQNRTLAYVQELFYDADGRVLWQKEYNPLRYKEMTSQEFDEDFYTSIVDSVFGQGEVERQHADDRWLLLWQETADNRSIRGQADTATMRMKGSNLVFWEWQEHRDADNNIAQILFVKKAVDLKQGIEKIIRSQQWTPARGWKDTSSEISGIYHPVEPGSSEELALMSLRDYAENHQDWINRYSLEVTK